MKRLFEILGIWTWEGFQSLLGLVVQIFLTGKFGGGLYNGRRLIWFKKGKFFSGTSLGYWILLPKDCSKITIAHEYGHCLQSKKSGPLYILLYGIDSLRNNLRARKDGFTHRNYYRLWPEYDADDRGGITWEGMVIGYRVLNEGLFQEKYLKGSDK